MKFINKLSIVVLTLILSSSAAMAQGSPAEGSWGLRASLVGQTSIELPYQLNDKLSIAPAVTFSGVDNTSTTFGLNILPRYYTNTNGSLSSYFMGNLGFNNTSFNGGGSETFFVLGAGYGAEYFFSTMFSMSADAGLTAELGGDIVNTLSSGARVSATVYF